MFDISSRSVLEVVEIPNFYLLQQVVLHADDTLLAEAHKLMSPVLLTDRSVSASRETILIGGYRCALCISAVAPIFFFPFPGNQPTALRLHAAYLRAVWRLFARRVSSGTRG